MHVKFPLLRKTLTITLLLMNAAVVAAQSQDPVAQDPRWWLVGGFVGMLLVGILFGLLVARRRDPGDAATVKLRTVAKPTQADTGERS